MDILVLGCSEIFLRRVLPALHFCDGISKIHIASKSKSKTDLDFKYHKKIGNWFDNYSIAIQSLCSQLVYISLPNHLHFIWAKNSLKAGFHVVVEKPVTLKFSETKLLIEISKDKKLCFAESVVWPFHPNIKILKDKLTQFQNNPIKVNASFTVPKFKVENFRNFKEFGGGAFNDMSAYAVSIGRVLFNEKPYSFSGKLLSFDESAHIDTGFFVNMSFSNDKTLNGVFGFGREYTNNLEISVENYKFELNRVFSPPSDLEVNLSTKIDQYLTNQHSKGDVYTNFFNSILETFNSSERLLWTEIMCEDASLKNQLKLEIIDENAN
jgi:predicted dehydrogenase